MSSWGEGAGWTCAEEEPLNPHRQFAVSALLAMLLSSGCKVVDAPENLEDLMVFAFEEFDANDRAMIAMRDELEPLAEEKQEELDDGYRINNLTTEDLEEVGVEDPDVEHIIGAVGSADYRHSVDEVMPAILHQHKEQVYDRWLVYDILEETDLQCFLAKECETYSMSVFQTVSVFLLGESSQTFDATYRWVIPDEGEGSPFVVARVLSPDPMEFSTNIVQIDQQYSMIVIYPLEGGGGRRVEAFWVESRVVGADIPDYFAVDNFASSQGDQAEAIDDYLDSLEAE